MLSCVWRFRRFGMVIRMVDIRIISNEEYRQGLRKEIEENGLKKSVEKRCDDIFEKCASMSYIPHMTVSEWLNEILDLVDESEK